MKSLSSYFGLGLLCLCMGCSHSDDAQDSHAFAHIDECHSLAESRLGLYVHSDIYPLSDKEKNDALTALASECMKQYRVKRAAPVVAAAPAANKLPPGMQVEQKEPAQIPAPAKEETTRKAVAAPVAPVTISSTPVTAATTPSQTIPANAPFAAAKAPPPEVAIKLRQPLENYQPPTNDNGKSELETILTRQ